MSEQAHWQVQEAKQRFSEVLRAVAKEGPQTITRHGEDVAVVIDIQYYRELTGRRADDFIEHLKAFPKMDSEGPDVFDEIEAERRQSFAPARDFEIELGLAEPAEPR
jgi:prevent-host-death family protein